MRCYFEHKKKQWKKIGNVMVNVYNLWTWIWSFTFLNTYRSNRTFFWEVQKSNFYFSRYKQKRLFTLIHTITVAKTRAKYARRTRYTFYECINNKKKKTHSLSLSIGWVCRISVRSSNVCMICFIIWAVQQPANDFSTRTLQIHSVLFIMFTL